ncbi:hypothetical protein BO71DRAFT_452675 [Aspergillus ellipticus CBS 707.79]|uniref:AMMECR1 domain-containing protein n=1 Tax=Aspergillus ellipticus CBS 707.79 TaxID=1448320 RepID=A0A319CZ77_9EURO|nr:hypothetical protein BO71DRAFT_452675 [Aspergillus ellipticus CBS 707.79]
MATPALCYYCFESLAASYKDKEPISLAALEELWERHEQYKKLAALNNETDPLDDDDDDDDEGPPPRKTKVPVVSRLQSDSSSSTTPSLTSTNSSQSMRSTPTTVTTPSSSSTRSNHPPREEKYPLFVTWNTFTKHGHKSLRGCIGTFEAKELAHGLKSYALTSAFDDSRFSPIPESLLSSLSCSLTLLGSFEPCTNPMDWVLGVHGLRISFIHCGRRYGATYLPDVAVEQGWTKEETVTSLMHKAGWNGPSESVARRLLRGSSSSNSASHGASGGASKPWDQVSDFRTVRYQGLKASSSYEEWQDWRQWVLSLEDGSDELLL